MAPPVLPTAPTAARVPDPDPLSADRTKRNVSLPPFSVFLTLSGLPPSTSAVSSTITPPSPMVTDSYEPESCDTYDSDESEPSCTIRIPPRQWTGTPIRAIVPLPRRKRNVVPNTANRARAVATHRNSSSSSRIPDVPVGNPALGAPSCLARSAHIQDDSDMELASLSGDEIEIEMDDGEGEEDRDASSGSRYCSYESITAAQGLSAWSFEELRVDCYAQSIIARGTRPSPVVQPMLAIPPAFAPRIVSQR